eukprot:238618_1
MSFTEKQLASIDRKSQLTVVGYIKGIEQLLKSSDAPLFNNIPESVILSCIFFYGPSEYFAIVGQYTTKISQYPMTTDNYGYGALIIPSMSKATYRWELSINSHYKVAIGISSNTNNNNKTINKDFAADFNNYCYGYNGYAGNICVTKPFAGNYKYGIPFGINDIVVMTLDLSCKRLSFEVNGKNQGIAFRSVRKRDKISYRLAITGSVHIVNFTAFYK